ncbi:transcriptional regulator Spx [Lactococcus raffinolactis]|uniref:transcriptional regulator Spx n=1 Tax=Pseudolactococcus raffinolactis TaxID=1366 RepID=UPI0034CEE865
MYTVAYSSSCDKANKWLKEHNLEFEEINLVKDQLSDVEILHLLSLTENGTEEIISKRGKAYQKLNVDLYDLSMNCLIKVIEKNRSLLRRPLIVDNKRFQVGYNEDDIRKFLPRSVRKIAYQTAEERIKKDLRLENAI